MATASIPGLMRAARLFAWSTSERLADIRLVEVPTPQPNEGEALIRVDAMTVSHLDLTVATGSFDIRPRLPHTPGVEGSGTIVSSPLHAPGTRVVLRGAGLGLTRPGTWSEYVTAPAETLLPVPGTLSPEIAATFLAPSTTAQVALSDVARLGTWGVDGVSSAADEVVIVTGAAGAVGSLAMQLALRAGSRVIALVSSEERAAHVPQGAEVVLSGDTERVRELASDRPGTLLVDTVGGAGLTARSRWVRTGGRAAVIGYLAGNEVTLDIANWMLAGVALLPVNLIASQHLARAHAPALTRDFAEGRLTLAVRAFALDDAEKAVFHLHQGHVTGRAVMVP